MSVRSVVISSLSELIAQVTPSDPDLATGRRRSKVVYRGAADASWPLYTSLDTLGGVSPPHSKADLEEHILRNFIRYARPHLGTTPVDEWEILVSAQHHGAPTRLLDWTYSPLVAAHFATIRGAPGVDRAVWQLDWKALHRRFGVPELVLQIEDLRDVFGPEH
ncbi:MAG TPA: FRG domain-containing protein, partial [Gemmatimonadales bacterium]|nr:FRG domain-containing protein [Gemmatimonadales bacterium]